MYHSWSVSDSMGNNHRISSSLQSIQQKELAEATEYLIQTIYGLESSTIDVTCQIEVSEQYQTKDLTIVSIEEYTQTTINQESGRRTSMTITGKPNQVCQARKLFDVSDFISREMNRFLFQLCLPIILTFEISMEKEPTRGKMSL